MCLYDEWQHGRGQLPGLNEPYIKHTYILQKCEFDGSLQTDNLIQLVTYRQESC